MGKANEIWKEIKPKIGEMLAVVNDVETRAEKAQEEAYQKGLSDAWDAARTLWNTAKRKEIFGYTVFNTALMALTGQEAIEKIRQYEQGKEEQIQVGDEVKNIECGWTAIVTKSEEGHLTLMCDSGAIANGYDAKHFAKTGRHFPEIAAVLEKMREDAT